MTKSGNVLSKRATAVTKERQCKKENNKKYVLKQRKECLKCRELENDCYVISEYK